MSKRRPSVATVAECDDDGDDSMADFLSDDGDDWRAKLEDEGTSAGLDGCGQEETCHVW